MGKKEKEHQKLLHATNHIRKEIAAQSQLALFASLQPQLKSSELPTVTP